MADEAGGGAGGAAAAAAAEHHDGHVGPVPIINRSRNSTWSKGGDINISGIQTPMSQFNRMSLIEPGLDSYFVGPRNMDAHSKLPYFLRLHGSVTPRMILPLTMIGCWATLITIISKKVHDLAVSTLLLTVLGFVVGLALSFRSTTAYERYSDGRKAWATLSVQSRNLARYLWIHIDERPECASQDLLTKVTAVNLVLAFAVSLKHKLRFEPYAYYPDISSLISHLDTFASAASNPNDSSTQKKKTPWKATGEYLGLSFASSNPRKAIKRSTAPLGNLPLEILNYLSCFVAEAAANGTLASPVMLGQVMTSLSALTDTMSAAERVLTTPLPVGYNILISQIVLLYVYLLPFQLFGQLGWITIPGTVAAAYIILGLAAIGNELENPFGNDVNDLPLDSYCAELAAELNFLMAVPMSTKGTDGTFASAVAAEGNKPLWPLSEGSAGAWGVRSEKEIRDALRAKVVVGNRAGSVLDGASAGGGSSAGSTKIGH